MVMLAAAAAAVAGGVPAGWRLAVLRLLQPWMDGDQFKEVLVWLGLLCVRL
jgi:hypothetical protein